MTDQADKRTGGINWAALVQLAARTGVPPREMWQLTPWELQALVGANEVGLAPAGLGALMQAYPDEQEKETGR